MSRIVVSEPLYCKLRTSTSHTRKTHFLFGLSPLPDLLPLQARATCLMFSIRRFASPPSPHTVSRSVHTKSRSAHAHTHAHSLSARTTLAVNTTNQPRKRSRPLTPAREPPPNTIRTPVKPPMQHSSHTSCHTPQHTPEHTHQNTACRLPRTTSIQHAAP